jgi:gamma-glutamyltranspeptidase/glutathione hydrolase
MTDSLLREFPSSRAIFTRDGVPLGPGDILYQHDLAKTLCKIAREGSDVFYRGEIAQAIVNFVTEQGGILSLKDMRDCNLRWEDPISTIYRGHTVFEAPPNSSGHVLLQELNLIENFDMSVLGCNTSVSIHAMVEAKKLAFADRETYLADPEFVDVPIEGLLSKQYAKERVELIDLERASKNVSSGFPVNHQEVNHKNGANISRSQPQEEDTTCFCVVDRWGNAVVQLQSLQSGFGSSLVVEGTGILLNNRMTYWHLEKDHVDCLQPGKRVRHTMNPVMIFDSINGNQELQLACGTPGADTQVQTNQQVISHVLDFGMNVVEAVEAPRWRHMQNPTESTYPHTCDDILQVEGRFAEDVISGLSERGHDLDIMGNWDAAGSEMMIQVDSQTGSLFGGADPRRDGYALGL